jgi:hypothetical protein
VITFCCWKWGQAGCRTIYNASHVNIWANMMKRHYKGEHRLVCITDNPRSIEIETFPLWNDHSKLRNPNGAHLPSCYRRLKIFSTPQQAAMGIAAGERVVSMDLDIVILRDITPMFDTHSEHTFFGWKRVSSNPKKPAGYNGSVFMFTAGKFDFLWDTFDAVESPMRTRKARQFGSDQGWISFNLDGNGPGWTQFSGMYSYSSDIYKHGLPPNARIVSFNGKSKPWMGAVKQHDPWIARHYW